MASEGVQAVEPISFDDLYAAHRSGMVRLAFALVDDLDVAEDLVQAAFAKVYQRRSSIEQPLAYLRSAVYNGCRNHHRWAKVRRLAPVRADRDQAPVGDHVIDVVRGLPHRKRAVVVLRFYAGWSDADIAAAMGMAEPTVRTTLHRALNDLREQLREEPS